VETLCFDPGVRVTKLDRYFFRGLRARESHFGISRAVINSDGVELSTSNVVLHGPPEIGAHELERRSVRDAFVCDTCLTQSRCYPGCPGLLGGIRGARPSW